MENPERYMTVNNEPEHIRETNLMQIELVKRKYGEAEAESNFDEWRTTYSVKFRQAVEKLMRANPHLLRDWNEPATHEVVLEEIEKDIYKLPEFDQAA